MSWVYNILQARIETSESLFFFSNLHNHPIMFAPTELGTVNRRGLLYWRNIKCRRLLPFSAVSQNFLRYNSFLSGAIFYLLRFKF